SINGGPDLYYVRVRLNSGAVYTTAPREIQIKTDVLLLQYCGDVTLANQTFTITPPLPTAVKLLAFTAAGEPGAVALAWETASELDNLGFHVYRAETGDGAYDRITDRIVPGLGSSPTGARYSFRDTSVTPGATYYYLLEDHDTGGGSERHGPVSAAPLTTPPAGGGPPAEGSDPGAVSYGDPALVSLRVIERDAT